MNIALFETSTKERFNAGNKARSDALKILLANGYSHIPLFYNGKAKPMVLLQIAKALLQVILRADRNSTVFIQYPYAPDVVNTYLIRVLHYSAKIKGFKLAVLIHDINALRSSLHGTVEGEKTLRRESNRLALCDHVICHNQAMIDQLKDVCPLMAKKCIGLEIFDYLYCKDVHEIKYWEGKPKVVVAGNLSKAKCGYIYNLNKIHNADFYLYGVGFREESATENVTFKGAFPPDQLIEHLVGHFGLVWDGSTTETCSGSYGNYLRYNDPHKFSLYMAAGLPAIVWKESALAQFVISNNIGIAVDSLLQLDTCLNDISKDDYQKMLSNVLAIREKVVNGRFLSKAINQLAK